MSCLRSFIRREAQGALGNNFPSCCVGVWLWSNTSKSCSAKPSGNEDARNLGATWAQNRGFLASKPFLPACKGNRFNET